MNPPIQIHVDYDHTEFTPGDTISGKVTWADVGKTKKVALRLFWHTTGRGTKDVELVHEELWPAAQSEGEFSIVLPSEPYSFSGKLIALKWALEAVILPEETTVIYEFVLSPNGKNIMLETVQESVTGKKKNKWFTHNQR
ncbi:MAG: hypothetical protein ACPG32_05365 [Akkermansiaceae bacterium]